MIGRGLRWLFSSRLLRWTFVAVVLAVVFVLASNWWIDHRSAPYVFDTVAALPHQEAALVLGTSEHTGGGRVNPFFSKRIEAALELYRSGKVDHLLLSGDNGRKDYNEPMAMRAALIAGGVDSTHITLDFAGFRTLDSVVRARAIFGLNSFIVVSQRFHNERAVYIARSLGMEAYGYNAPDVTGRSGRSTLFREKFARSKVFLDLLFGVEPHFLGEPVELGAQVLPEV